MPHFTSEIEEAQQSTAKLKSTSDLQTAIHMWYGEKHPDSANIFSPEWQRRISSWRNHFIATHPNQNPDGVINLNHLDELDLEIFFLAAPVPGFALWELMQACYEVDRAICGLTEAERAEILLWQDIKPLKYLQSERLKGSWKSELETLNDRFYSRSVTQASFEERLNSILAAVERLEAARKGVQDAFDASTADSSKYDIMQCRILNAVDDRCRIVERSFMDLTESMDREAPDKIADESWNKCARLKNAVPTPNQYKGISSTSRHLAARSLAN